MPGRRPKPTAVKKLAGNPGKHPLNENEPKFGGTATCPRALDAEARKEWRRVSAELKSMGMLTTVDRGALAAYCTCWSRWIKAEQQVEKYGMVIKNPVSGLPITNPYVNISHKFMDSMRKFQVEFGMTPSSRSKINVMHTKPTKEDEWGEFVEPIRRMDVPSIPASGMEIN